MCLGWRLYVNLHGDFSDASYWRFHLHLNGDFPDAFFW